MGLRGWGSGRPLQASPRHWFLTCAAGAPSTLSLVHLRAPLQAALREALSSRRPTLLNVAISPEAGVESGNVSGWNMQGRALGAAAAVGRRRALCSIDHRSCPRPFHCRCTPSTPPSQARPEPAPLVHAGCARAGWALQHAAAYRCSIAACIALPTLAAVLHPVLSSARQSSALVRPVLCPLNLVA